MVVGRKRRVEDPDLRQGSEDHFVVQKELLLIASGNGTIQDTLDPNILIENGEIDSKGKPLARQEPIGTGWQGYTITRSRRLSRAPA